MGGKAGIYAVLAVIGFIVPLVFVGKFIAAEGLNFALMGEYIFGNPLAKAVFLDVAISSIVFWVWLSREAPKAGMSWWYYVPLNLFVGLCFALPLFLYNRERKTAAG